MSLKVLSPNEKPFGFLSNSYYYPLYYEGKMYSCVLNYVLSKLLFTPIYKDIVQTTIPQKVVREFLTLYNLELNALVFTLLSEGIRFRLEQDYQMARKLNETNQSFINYIGRDFADKYNLVLLQARQKNIPSIQQKIGRDILAKNLFNTWAIYQILISLTNSFLLNIDLQLIEKYLTTETPEKVFNFLSQYIAEKKEPMAFGRPAEILQIYENGEMELYFYLFLFPDFKNVFTFYKAFLLDNYYQGKINHIQFLMKQQNIIFTSLEDAKLLPTKSRPLKVFLSHQIPNPQEIFDAKNQIISMANLRASDAMMTKFISLLKKDETFKKIWFDDVKIPISVEIPQTREEKKNDIFQDYKRRLKENPAPSDVYRLSKELANLTGNFEIEKTNSIADLIEILDDIQNGVIGYDLYADQRLVDRRQPIITIHENDYLGIKYNYRFKADDIFFNNLLEYVVYRIGKIKGIQLSNMTVENLTIQIELWKRQILMESFTLILREKFSHTISREILYLTTNKDIDISDGVDSTNIAGKILIRIRGELGSLERKELDMQLPLKWFESSYMKKWIEDKAREILAFIKILEGFYPQEMQIIFYSPKQGEILLSKILTTFFGYKKWVRGNQFICTSVNETPISTFNEITKIFFPQEYKKLIWAYFSSYVCNFFQRWNEKFSGYNPTFFSFHSFNIKHEQEILTYEKPQELILNISPEDEWIVVGLVKLMQKILSLNFSPLDNKHLFDLTASIILERNVQISYVEEEIPTILFSNIFDEMGPEDMDENGDAIDMYDEDAIEAVNTINTLDEGDSENMFPEEEFMDFSPGFMPVSKTLKNYLISNLPTREINNDFIQNFMTLISKIKDDPLSYNIKKYNVNKYIKDD